MPCEVRSPGQVKWPNYKNNFSNRATATMFQGKLWSFQNMMSSHQCLQKTYISDFWYRWPQVRSFLRPPHYKSMGKKSTPLYLLCRKHIWVQSYRIGQFVDNSRKNLHCLPLERSFEVTRDQKPSFANNFLSKREIETWNWWQYVRLGQANPMICNMTHFGHHVTLAWLDPRSNFDLDLSKSFYIWFDAP